MSLPPESITFESFAFDWDGTGAPVPDRRA